MSMESAKSFVERMKTDEDFRNKVNECKDGETRMALVRQKGFDFTEEEVKQFSKELSDEVLDALAGGGCGHFLVDGNQICRVVW